MTNTLQQAEIDELKIIFDQFTKKLHDKINIIEKICEDQKYSFSDDAILELYRIVHTLSGSCETFGYYALGKSANKLALLLISIQKNESKINYDNITSDVKQLRIILQETNMDEAFSEYLKLNMTFLENK